MVLKKQETGRQLMDSFRRIVHALRSSHRAAEDNELTGAQLFVLATLGSAEGPMGVKDLADQSRTDQSTVSVVVGRLVDRGLVRRVRSTSDTRRVELSLTVRGRNLLRRIPTTVAQRRLADALSQLSASDSAALERILKMIVEMMGEGDAPAPMLFDEGGASEGRRVSPKPRPRNQVVARKARTRGVRK